MKIHIIPFAVLSYLMMPSVNAAVTITFSELNGHVVATTSGSLVAETESVSSSGYIGTTLQTSADEFYGVQDHIARGVFGEVESGMPVALPQANYFSGDTFGFDSSGVLFYKEAWDSGDTLSPVSSQWIWISTTLEELFAGAAPYDATLVWSDDTGEQIYFVAVPEPSVSLFCVAAGAFLCRRRRS